MHHFFYDIIGHMQTLTKMIFQRFSVPFRSLLQLVFVIASYFFTDIDIFFSRTLFKFLPLVLISNQAEIVLKDSRDLKNKTICELIANCFKNSDDLRAFLIRHLKNKTICDFRKLRQKTVGFPFLK